MQEASNGYQEVQEASCACLEIEKASSGYLVRSGGTEKSPLDIQPSKKCLVCTIAWGPWQEYAADEALR